MKIAAGKAAGRGILRSAGVIVGTLLALGAVAPAAAQVPDEFKNLKVLPRKIQKEPLLQTMREFSGGLGVRCEYCHVEKEGKPRPAMDFASDEKAPKKTARAMMRTVRDLNEKHIARLDVGTEPKLKVTCATCHHGLARPESLQAILTRLTDEKGLDTALVKYRELRDRYYGGYEFAFGDRPLSYLMEHLADGGKAAEAVRVGEYNVETHPDSSFAVLSLGELHARLGNRGKAIASFKKAMEIDPDNPRAKRRLQEMEQEGERK